MILFFCLLGFLFFQYLLIMSCLVVVWYILWQRLCKVSLISCSKKKIKACKDTIGSYWGACASKLVIAVIRKKDGNKWLVELEFFYFFLVCAGGLLC